MKTPYTEKELQKMSYLCNLPLEDAQAVYEHLLAHRRFLAEQGKGRQVFVLWNNENIDYSTIKGVYATKQAAEAACDGLFFDIECVPFYE